MQHELYLFESTEFLYLGPALYCNDTEVYFKMEVEHLCLLVTFDVVGCVL